MQCTSISPKNSQKLSKPSTTRVTTSRDEPGAIAASLFAGTQARARIATPPTAWLKPTNFSAAKLRSANCVLKNIAANDPIANALMIQACCVDEYPKLGRYPKISGNHAPQMKNSRNIIAERRTRAGVMGEDVSRTAAEGARTEALRIESNASLRRSFSCS